MEQLSTSFKALADPTRLRIMNLLFRRSFCVCEMERILRLSQPLLSRHLAYLRSCGLVESHRDGMRVHYNLKERHPIVMQLRSFLVDVLSRDEIGRADLQTLKAGDFRGRNERNRKRERYTETNSRRSLRGDAKDDGRRALVHREGGEGG